MRFERELDSIRGVGPASDRGQEVIGAAVRLVEALVGRIQLELNSERSALLGELASAKARVNSLERQLNDTLQLLLDAQRHRKPGLIRSGLLALAGFMAGVGTGFAEGAGGAFFESVHADGAAPVTVEYSISCYALDHVLDAVGVYSAGIANAVEQGSSDSEQERSEDQTDGRDELDPAFDDPWLAEPPELGAEYVIWKEAGFSPSEALDWADFGFVAEEAIRWLAYRFSPPEARAWIDRSLDSNMRESIEPSMASEYDEFEFSPNEAMEWREQGLDASTASEWREFSFEPDESADWLAEGFDAEKADDWRSRHLAPRGARLDLDGRQR